MFFLSFDVSKVKQFDWKSDFFTFIVISADDGSNLIEGCNFVLVNQGVNISFDETCVILSFLEDGVCEDSLQKLQVVFQTNDFVIFKGSLHFLDGFGSGIAVSDELGNHGIIKCWDGVVLTNSSLDSYSLLLFGFFEIFQLTMIR